MANFQMPNFDEISEFSQNVTHDIQMNMAHFHMPDFDELSEFSHNVTHDIQSNFDDLSTFSKNASANIQTNLKGMAKNVSINQFFLISLFVIKIARNKHDLIVRIHMFSPHLLLF